MLKVKNKRAYAGLPYHDLQRLCKERKLKAVGNTTALIKRLADNDEREIADDLDLAAAATAAELTSAFASGSPGLGRWKPHG